MFQIATLLVETTGTYGTGFTESLHQEDRVDTPDEAVVFAVYSVILKILKPNKGADWATYFAYLLDEIKRINFTEFQLNIHEAEREAMAERCGITRLERTALAVAGIKMCDFDPTKFYEWEEIQKRILDSLWKLRTYYIGVV